MNDLAAHIQAARLIDTHEHLRDERAFIEHGPDVLQDLFDNYVTADLVVSGANEDAVKRLLDASDPDLAGRFAGVRDAWERCRHTGYGEAVRLIARLVYGMEEIASESLEGARSRNLALRQPGQRLRLLRDTANLDHVQVDDFRLQCEPDASGPGFFLYDLSWAEFCSGTVDVQRIHGEVGVVVGSLAGLRQSIEAIFHRYGPYAIAVKSQHAYVRTLRWEERSDADAERALLRQLQGEELGEDERLCLGDWCMARGVEQAIAHDLPFKIHTGYYAGHSHMPIERIRAAHLCALLARYPAARFVLMHAAYPYSAELIALAKHYPNVYIDMCWAWSIDPYSACDTLRRTLHTVPANKVFAFGGDTSWPAAAVGYAAQARSWITRALSGEVEDGLLSEREAIALATRLMRENQLECFDVAGRRAMLLAEAPAVERV
jgi:uncharacterized protein